MKGIVQLSTAVVLTRMAAVRTFTVESPLRVETSAIPELEVSFILRQMEVAYSLVEPVADQEVVGVPLEAATFGQGAVEAPYKMVVSLQVVQLVTLPDLDSQMNKVRETGCALTSTWDDSG